MSCVRRVRRGEGQKDGTSKGMSVCAARWRWASRSESVRVRRAAFAESACPQSSADQGEEDRDFRIRIAPRLRGKPAVEQGWTLHGRAKRAFVLVPRFVDFGTTLVRGEAAETRMVWVRSAVPLKDFAVRSGSPPLRVAVEAIGGEAREYKVSVTPDTSQHLGAFEETVSLGPVGAEQAVLPPVELSVRGTVLDAVQAAPAKIVCGAKPVGELIEETVLLTSVRGKEFAVERITGASPVTEIESVGAQAANRRVFRIRQRVTALRNQKVQVRFRVRLGDREPFEVPVELTYFGMRKVD